jgi:transcriptional regulator with XRE-family HTH domain
MGMTSVAAYLRVLREQRGLSREKLAEMIDTSGNTIWRIEDGRQEPGGALLLNLIAAVRGSYEDVRRLLAEDNGGEAAGRELAELRVSRAEFAKIEELRTVLGNERLAEFVARLSAEPDLLDAIDRLMGRR